MSIKINVQKWFIDVQTTIVIVDINRIKEKVLEIIETEIILVIIVIGLGTRI